MTTFGQSGSNPGHLNSRSNCSTCSGQLFGNCRTISDLAEFAWATVLPPKVQLPEQMFDTCGAPVRYLFADVVARCICLRLLGQLCPPPPPGPPQFYCGLPRLANSRMWVSLYTEARLECCITTEAYSPPRRPLDGRHENMPNQFEVCSYCPSHRHSSAASIGQHGSMFVKCCHTWLNLGGCWSILFEFGPMPSCCCQVLAVFGGKCVNTPRKENLEQC